MKKISMVAMGLLLAASQVNAAEASDGVIRFEGAISSQTCTINVAGKGPSPTIPLPKVATAAFADSKVAGTTRFTMALSNCSTQTGEVYAHFEQGNNVNTDGRLINTGTAKNVDVRLLDSDNTPINAGSTAQSEASKKVPLDKGAATLTYSAQYFATGAPEAGSVSASVNYSINYL